MKTLLFLFIAFISSVRSDWPCPCGLYNILGTCKTPTCIVSPVLPACVTSCPPGKWPAQHLCFDIPHCPDDKAALHGQCVSKCNATESPADENCVECEPPAVKVDGQCLPCPMGTRPVNNLCLLDCPSGYRLIGTECQPFCPYWQEAVNQTCVNLCQTGWKAELRPNGNVECWPSCPQELVTFEELCVEECPSRYIPDFDNVCFQIY